MLHIIRILLQQGLEAGMVAEGSDQSGGEGRNVNCGKTDEVFAEHGPGWR